MNSHSVNDWLQINQSSPTAWHTGQICLSAGLLVCISCHKSVTESEIDQSVVKTLYFRTMLRSSRGCLKPEFLLLLHNKSSGPRCRGMSWQEVARVVHTLVMFVFMFLLLAVLLECVRPGIQSTAELQQQSAQQANTVTHTDTKTCLTTCLLRWGVGGEGSCNLSLSYTYTHTCSKCVKVKCQILSL